MENLIKKYFNDKGHDFSDINSMINFNCAEKMKAEINNYIENKTESLKKLKAILPIIEKAFKEMNCSLLSLNKVVAGTGGFIRCPDINEIGTHEYKFSQCDKRIFISGIMKYNGKQIKPTCEYNKAVTRLSRLEQKFKTVGENMEIRINPYSIKRDTNHLIFEIACN